MESSLSRDRYVYASFRHRSAYSSLILTRNCTSGPDMINVVIKLI